MRASAAELAIVHQARAGLSVLRRTRDDRRRLVRPQRVRAALATEVAHEHFARVRLRQPRLVTRVLLPLARVRARLRRPAPRVGRRQPQVLLGRRQPQVLLGTRGGDPRCWRAAS